MLDSDIEVELYVDGNMQNIHEAEYIPESEMEKINCKVEELG
jgi:hypothetical protein